jgi:hypothetical protein
MQEKRTMSGVISIRDNLAKTLFSHIKGAKEYKKGEL